MKEIKSIHAESAVDRPLAAEHLRGLAAGLRSGRLTLTEAGRAVNLTPVGPVELHLTARSGAGGGQVTVRLSWGHIPDLWR